MAKCTILVRFYLAASCAAISSSLDLVPIPYYIYTYAAYTVLTILAIWAIWSNPVRTRERAGFENFHLIQSATCRPKIKLEHQAND